MSQVLEGSIHLKIDNALREAYRMKDSSLTNREKIKWRLRIKKLELDKARLHKETGERLTTLEF